MIQMNNETGKIIPSHQNKHYFDNNKYMLIYLAIALEYYNTATFVTSGKQFSIIIKFYTRDDISWNTNKQMNEHKVNTLAIMIVLTSLNFWEEVWSFHTKSCKRLII